MKKKIYLISCISLGMLLIVDLLFPDHGHAHFEWHRWPGFDILCGLIGGVVLAKLTLGSGYLFLWRPNFSISLSQYDLTSDTESFFVKEIFVEKGDRVKEKQVIANILQEETIIPIEAPMDGKVSKIFIHPKDMVDTNQTLIDMAVSHSILHHDHKERTTNV